MYSLFSKFLAKGLVFALCLCMVLAPDGYGQHRVNEGQRRLLFDHEAHRSRLNQEDVKESFIEELGARIDLSTGELSLRHTDISLPGNFDLPVKFTRIIDSDPDRPNFFGNATSASSRGLANWHVDLEYILLPSIKSNGKIGCISASTEVDVKDELFVTPRVNMNGELFDLLKKNGSGNKAIFGNDQPDYTTKSGLKIHQTKQRNSCKWTARDTDGNVYEFGQVRVIATKDGKRKHAVLITKVTDVYGNYVSYTYEGREKRLTWIRSSDNRVIKFVYNHDGTLECAIANAGSTTTTKIVWIYRYSTAKGRTTKYLSSVNSSAILNNWTFDELAGIHRHYNGVYARRCGFGANAKIQSPSGLVGEFKTKKIVNFAQAEKPDGHKSTSHRAACLPTVDIFDKNHKEYPADEDWDAYYRPYKHEQEVQEYRRSYKKAQKGPSLGDGTSIYGNFATYFTSAVTEVKLTDTDKTVSTMTIEYGEGDLYNPNSASITNKTVHKNINSPVNIDTTKPKTRTITDFLGNKIIFKIGRSLTDSGRLISKKIFAKGSNKAAYIAKFEYVSSGQPLGHAWNRGRLNQKLAEHWTRRSKKTVTIDSSTYVTEYEYDAYGYTTKTTKSSTLQSEKMIEVRTFTHVTKRWILGLVKTFSLNGKEMIANFYDSSGRRILENRFGSQYKRFSWSIGRLHKERNGGDETTEFTNYKRGIPKTVKHENGAIERRLVDDNGWITQTTTPSGYIEKFSHDSGGRVTKIDRMTGYADTTIVYSRSSVNKSITKTETTGSGASKKKIVTTYNGFGKPILIETRDVTKNKSIYVRIKYDKLQREVFRSFPSYEKTATAGIEFKYDVLNRKIQERENVAPFATVSKTYLTNNRIRTTDAEGNSTLESRSGYGSPDDGKVTKIVKPNGQTTYNTYDKWQNLTKIRVQAGGKTRTSIFKFNSLHQSCFESHPDTGTKATEYNDAGRISRVEVGVDVNYSCSVPAKVYITGLERRKSCTTTTKWVLTGGWQEPEPVLKNITTCRYYYPKTKIEKSLSRTSPTIPSISPSTQKGILLTYNTLGKLAKVNFPNNSSSDIVYSYNLEGWLTKVVRGNVTLEYTYGKRGELLSENLKIIEADENNRKTTKKFKASYTYNNTGGRLTFKTPSDRIIKYTLNAFNQATSLSIGELTYISEVKYHENGEIESAELHNTNSTNNSDTITLSSTQNQRKLTNNFKLKKTGKDPVFSFDTTFDKARRVKNVTSSLAAVGNRKFTYDSSMQISSVSGDGNDVSLSYDLFENLVTRVVGSVTRTNVYDKTSGELTKVSYSNSKQSDTVSHDKFGQITKLGDFNFTYDDANRIVQVKKVQGLITKINQKNVYDGLDRRVSAHTTYGTGNTGVRNDYEFFSVFGERIHRQIVQVKTSNSNTTTNNKPGNYDLIPFTDNLILQFGECAEWIINHKHNNFIIWLNADNSVRFKSSFGPFGNSMSGKAGVEKNCSTQSKSNSGSNTTLSNFISKLQVASVNTPAKKGVQGVTNHANTRTHVFQETIMDEFTEIFFLLNKSYYSAKIGRYLSPQHKFKHAQDLTKGRNRYSIEQNDPVNYRYNLFTDFDSLEKFNLSDDRER